MKQGTSWFWLLAVLGTACGSYAEDGDDEGIEVAQSALTTETRTYVSELPFLSATNGRGPVERDRSNGERNAEDGTVLTVAGRQFARGLGVHSNSRVVLGLAGAYVRFESYIGIDDEVGDFGSVRFQVLADGRSIFQSGVLLGSNPLDLIRIDVTGVQRLELIVRDGGDGPAFDHADWALARLFSSTPPPPPPPPAAGACELGPSGSLRGRQIFGKDTEWNRDVSTDAIDEKSSTYIASMGAAISLRPDFGTVYEGAPFGIPYIVVPGNQARVPMRFDWDDESDAGPYPFPLNAPIEGGPDGDGDRHIIAVDCEGGRLYESYASWPSNGGFDAASGAIFNLDGSTHRPRGWTSADAAGLPIFPGLVRHDEVVDQGEIRHALRFTVRNTQRAYVYPASHFASTKVDPNLPPMGIRVRLKASYDISRFPKEAQVILRALKKYGMFLADNGADWFLSGAPHPQWNEDALFALRQVKGSDFEVLKTGQLLK